MAKVARVICLHCDNRMSYGASFCPSCEHPTGWATHEERVNWELQNYRKLQQQPIENRAYAASAPVRMSRVPRRFEVEPPPGVTPVSARDATPLHAPTTSASMRGSRRAAVPKRQPPAPTPLHVAEQAEEPTLPPKSEPISLPTKSEPISEPIKSEPINSEPIENAQSTVRELRPRPVVAPAQQVAVAPAPTLPAPTLPAAASPLAPLPAPVVPTVSPAAIAPAVVVREQRPESLLLASPAAPQRAPQGVVPETERVTPAAPATMLGQQVELLRELAERLRSIEDRMAGWETASNGGRSLKTRLRAAKAAIQRVRPVASQPARVAERQTREP